MFWEFIFINYIIFWICLCDESEGGWPTPQSFYLFILACLPWQRNKNVNTNPRVPKCAGIVDKQTKMKERKKRMSKEKSPWTCLLFEKQKRSSPSTPHLRSSTSDSNLSLVIVQLSLAQETLFLSFNIPRKVMFNWVSHFA